MCIQTRRHQYKQFKELCKNDNYRRKRKYENKKVLIAILQEVERKKLMLVLEWVKDMRT